MEQLFFDNLTYGHRRPEEMANVPEQIVVTDAMANRDRTSRLLVAITSFVVTVGTPAVVFAKILYDSIGYPKLGIILGTGVGIFAFFTFILNRIIVQVRLNRAFVTVNQLRSYLGYEDVYTVYGPGTHISYPWESREERSNIPLQEVSQDFMTTVITKSGAVTVSGSYRIRPRFGTESLIAFLGGVGAIASDLGDIIKRFITEKLAHQTIDTAALSVGELNDKLAEHFGRGGPKHPEVSSFEERFGLVVGDITVAQLRLSAEAEKTRTAIDEAKIINRGTAILLNFSESLRNGEIIYPEQKLEQALKSGKITRAEADKARDRFMAASENIKMDASTSEMTFRLDADPEVVKAIASIGPAIVPFLQQIQRNSEPKKGGA